MKARMPPCDDDDGDDEPKEEVESQPLNGMRRDATFQMSGAPIARE
jgi:hypothetical protein